jgi:hypothetical protein
MNKISRILNPVADEFFRSGIFRLNVFSLLFWCITFTGTAIGFHSGALLGAMIGSVLGFVGGHLFLALCYLTFHFLARIGWVVHPKDRKVDHAA